MIVRALYRSIAIPDSTAPYDRASLKVFYPANYGDSDAERNTGVIPADPAMAPFPVLIMMPGINVGPEAYSWLARLLAERGVVTVTYTLVAEEMPGYISLTPGLSIQALTHETYGKTPSATALAPILEDLHALNGAGVLAGMLDMQRIVLGGHSAGGTVALLNGRPDWFPGVCAAFSYGAHAGAATALGYGADAMFPVPCAIPLLIMGGNRDGCIANSSGRYGDQSGSATERVERTFDESLQVTRNDSYLAIVDGANHFSLAYPEDDSTGRPFIDLPTTQADPALRELLASLISLFVDATARDDEKARNCLESILLQDHALIVRGDRR